MPKLQVVARVPLPDIAPIGAPVIVDVTRRVEGLIARGLVEVIAAATPARDELPTGTIAELLSWVGDDPARAAALLARESESTAPRTTLIARLSAIVDPLGPADPDDDYDASEGDGDTEVPLSLVGA